MFGSENKVRKFYFTQPEALEALTNILQGKKNSRKKQHKRSYNVKDDKESY